MEGIFEKAFLDNFEGEVETTLLHRSVYATDASVCAGAMFTLSAAAVTIVGSAHRRRDETIVCI